MISYLAPTTQALTTAVTEQIQSAPAIILQNHGVLVLGHSVSQALLRLNLLEEQAGIYLQALAAGQPRLLSPTDMQKLDEITGGRYKLLVR